MVAYSFKPFGRWASAATDHKRQSNHTMTPLPNSDGIRAIAREYALECKASGVKPTLKGIAARFDRAPCWLTTANTPTSQWVRAIVIHEWIALDIRPAVELRPDPPRTPEPPTLGSTPEASFAEVPNEYLAGDELFYVLSHPGRLRQFCSLAETAGIGGALRYAQQIWKLYHAPDTAAKDAA